MNAITVHNPNDLPTIDYCKLRILQGDLKTLSEENLTKLCNSILKHGFFVPAFVWRSGDDMWILDATQRYHALEALERQGYEIPLIPYIEIEAKDKKDAAEKLLQITSRYGTINEDTSFFEDFNIDLSFINEITIPELDIKLDELEQIEEGEHTKLTDKFIIPPFSVFDTRQGYWQERKRAWLLLGIQSELGRGEGNMDANIRQNEYKKGLLYKTTNIQTTSIFDPVLSEITYKWFCPENGKVLDPFAGGSVRGIVAAYLGYEYIGIELREEQVKANITQAEEIIKNPYSPEWIIGDSNNLNALITDANFDFIFSCPPYYDLEVYSDLEGELSAIPTYEEFIAKYHSIIKNTIALLKEDRFACFVVGDIRDKKGFYRNFVSDTITGFHKANMQLYNEAILVNVIGSLPIRIGKAFGSYRKLGKCHQNVLVFYKGDVTKIKDNYAHIEVEDITLEQNTH